MRRRDQRRPRPPGLHRVPGPREGGPRPGLRAWSSAAPPRSWPWGSRGWARRSRSWAGSATTSGAATASSDMAEPRHRPLAGHPRRRPEDGRDGVDHPPARPRARHLPGRDQRPDRRGRAGRRDGRARPPPRLLLLLPGGPAPGLPGPLRPRAPRRAHHVARHRLRPERAVGRRAAGDAARDRPLLPERGGARGAHRHATTPRRACAGSRTGARASWPSWGRTGR